MKLLALPPFDTQSACELTKALSTSPATAILRLIRALTTISTMIRQESELLLANAPPHKYTIQTIARSDLCLAIDRRHANLPSHLSTNVKASFSTVFNRNFWVGYPASFSRSALASFRSAVSKPSVNHL